MTDGGKHFIYWTVCICRNYSTYALVTSYVHPFREQIELKKKYIIVLLAVPAKAIVHVGILTNSFFS